jgi:hypothetical protein
MNKRGAKKKKKKKREETTICECVHLFHYSTHQILRAGASKPACVAFQFAKDMRHSEYYELDLLKWLKKKKKKANPRK